MMERICEKWGERNCPGFKMVESNHCPLEGQGLFLPSLGRQGRKQPCL